MIKFHRTQPKLARNFTSKSRIKLKKCRKKKREKDWNMLVRMNIASTRLLKPRK